MPIRPLRINGRYPFTQNNVLFTFQLYLKTWMNIILKERSIYPETSFETRNSFNIKVPWQRHPEFNTWCDQMIETLINKTVFHKCKNISLLIYDTLEEDEIGSVKERYVINIQEFPHLMTHNEANFDKEFKEEEKVPWEDIYAELRANLYSLITKIRSLSKNEVQGLRFNIACETMGIAMDDKDWVLEDDNDYPEGIAFKKPENLIPLRTVDVGPMVFYSAVEVYK